MITTSGIGCNETHLGRFAERSFVRVNYRASAFVAHLLPDKHEEATYISVLPPRKVFASTA
jgi:hypothetical protein